MLIRSFYKVCLILGIVLLIVVVFQLGFLLHTRLSKSNDEVTRLKNALIWDPSDLSTYIGPNVIKKNGRYYPREGVVTAAPYETTLDELEERGCFVPVFSYFTKGYQEVSARVFTEKLGQSLAFYYDDIEAMDGKIRRISMAFSQYGISNTAKDYFFLQHNGRDYLFTPTPMPDGTGTGYTINFYLGDEYAYPYVYIGSDYLINGIPELFKIIEGMTIDNPSSGLPTAQL